jgi:mRNA-degrading endonuclease RelE of RelBE toxin-antitoxin system
VQRFVWSDAARADIRALDRVVAMRVFDVLQRYVVSGEGDVKQLQGREHEFRLRTGDYRICFTREGAAIHIQWVRHRSQAYR